ncbi:MAG: LPS export ABC transporter periplasmic protein LptC [Deltaproteobacteria bacterium]|nr:LPS export ABC transporter periplasmic protein LptC [Deltaproteobacteria bacterium]
MIEIANKTLFYSLFIFLVFLKQSGGVALQTSTYDESGVRFRSMPKHIQISDISGVIVQKDKTRIKIEAVSIQTYPLLGISIFKKPRLSVFGNDGHLTFQSDVLTYNHLKDDYIFEDHVLLKAPNKSLETNFLKFSPSTMQANTFGSFTAFFKNKIFQGKGLLADLIGKKLTLLNVPHYKHPLVFDIHKSSY